MLSRAQDRLTLKLRLFHSGLSDADAAHFNISAQEKADFMEEVTTELSVYLGMLYHMVEVFKSHDDFADELSQCVRIYVRFEIC